MAERTGKKTKPRMFRITHPEPLGNYPHQQIAKAAGCSAGLISQLRTGKTTDTAEGIARGIAKACRVSFEDMFEDTGRRQHDRRPKTN
jgi:transcriptional regulator with XRE-family HTH domain